MTTNTQKKTKQVKKTTSKKVTKTTPPTSNPTPAPVQETQPVVTADPVVQTTLNEEELSDSFKTITNNLSTIASNLKSLVGDVKKLEKRVSKDLREAKKSKKKGKSSTGEKPKRAPSGFAKPSDISEELCNFLGVPLGKQMARTEVTKHVTQYIKDQGLQNPENKRHILPDQKLKALLGATDDEEVTYFNLQKFMKHHFPTSKSQQTTA